MNRIVFTFGTLHEDDVVEALLGRVPHNFYAILPDYAIYRAGFSQLSAKTKEFILSKGYDPQTFSFLYLKADDSPTALVKGRAYYLEPEDELVLDQWEGYPDWYDKLPVSIQDSSGRNCEAFVYSGNFAGEKLQTFTRVVNHRETVLANAKKARQEVLGKR
jgi:hypothetical protein